MLCFLVFALLARGTVYAFVLDAEDYLGQFAALATSLGLLLLRYRRADAECLFKAWRPAVWRRSLFVYRLLRRCFARQDTGKLMLNSDT